MKTYTLEQFRKYLESQDSMGDIFYNLNKIDDFLEKEEDLDVDSIRLECTCRACPEQYNAYKGEEYVGYLRLRHGYFYVDNKNEETIYQAYPKGDGAFDSEERDFYLNEAKKAILKSLNKL